MDSETRASLEKKGRSSALYPCAVALLFLLRLLLVWKSSALPPHFYSDSASHVLIGHLLFKNILPWSWRFFPLPGMLYAVGVRCGLDILYSPFFVNGTLAAIGICCIYSGTRETADSATAALAAILVVSLPSFARLIFSADQEMTALALTSAAFRCVCMGAALRGKPKFLRHMAAVGLLGASLYARSENAGLFVLSALALSVSWSEEPPRASLILVWAGFWLWLRAPAVFVHFQATSHLDAAKISSLNLPERLQILPRALAADWPLCLLLSFGAAIVWVESKSPVAGAVFGVAILQGLMLWFASFEWGNSIYEVERNVCIVLTALAIPAAAVIRAGTSRLRPLAAAAAGILLLALLGASWSMSARSGPMVPQNVEECRRLGWSLRRLAANGGLGASNSLILLEAVDETWPNAVVFSGLQDRIRIFSDGDFDFGGAFSWNGREPIGTVVLRSESTSPLAKTAPPLGRLLARDGPFRIYEVPRP